MFTFSAETPFGIKFSLFWEPFGTWVCLGYPVEPVCHLWAPFGDLVVLCGAILDARVGRALSGSFCLSNSFPT